MKIFLIVLIAAHVSPVFAFGAVPQEGSSPSNLPPEVQSDGSLVALGSFVLEVNIAGDAVPVNPMVTQLFRPEGRPPELCWANISPDRKQIRYVRPSRIIEIASAKVEQLEQLDGNDHYRYHYTLQTRGDKSFTTIECYFDSGYLTPTSLKKGLNTNLKVRFSPQQEALDRTQFGGTELIVR